MEGAKWNPDGPKPEAPQQGHLPAEKPAAQHLLDYVSYFCHHWDKIPTRSNLREERLDPARGLTIGKMLQLEGMVCGGGSLGYGLFTSWKMN